MRKGKISDVDYKNGMVTVIYLDGPGGVTDMLPYLNIGDEYKMPKIGDTVVVARSSIGKDIVLGKIWNRGNKPEVYGEGKYHKRLSESATIYASDKDNMKIKDKDIIFETDKGQITVNEILRLHGKI